MRINGFRAWLEECGYPSNFVNSRSGNCKRICTYEGDLDDLYKKDGCKDLLARLCYSTDDERHNRPAKHRIPIDGNKRTGSATLKQAVNLYIKFLNATPTTRNNIIMRSNRKTKKTNDWPTWEQPSDEECYQLASVTMKYVKFINPEIVKCIVEENDREYESIYAALNSHGINPDLYLWEKTSCCFPGVRRHEGRDEINAFKNKSEIAKIQNALILDDNSYPKQLWTFIFKGTKYGNKGPKGYTLAHLVDHKKDKNRMENEFIFPSDFKFKSPFYGLYTCATNAVYVPNNLTKPTDFNGPIRNLLVRKAMELYSPICNIIPPSIKIKENNDERWNLENFEWAAPVGTLDNISAFMEFRRNKLKEILGIK